MCFLEWSASHYIIEGLNTGAFTICLKFHYVAPQFFIFRRTVQIAPNFLHWNVHIFLFGLILRDIPNSITPRITLRLLPIPVQAVPPPPPYSLPPFVPCPGQKNRRRPVPVPVTGVRYNSLLWMCTVNTLTWTLSVRLLSILVGLLDHLCTRQCRRPPPPPLLPPHYSPPTFFSCPKSRNRWKACTCARDRLALQQLALNVHVKHWPDLTSLSGCIFSLIGNCWKFSLSNSEVSLEDI